MNLIVDSGATKSIWCISEGDWHREITLPGINFSQADPQKVGEVVYEAIRSIREIQKQWAEDASVDRIYVYGAGIVSEASALPLHLCLERMLNVPEHTETLEQGLMELEALLRAFSEPFLPVWRNYDHRAPLPEYHKVLISQLSQPLEALLQKTGICPRETELSVLAELLLAASQREEGTIEKLIPIMKKIVM